jgi:hypothetical protein
MEVPIFLLQVEKGICSLISEIKAGGTDVPKVSNVQTRHIQVNQGLEISSVYKPWHVF